MGMVLLMGAVIWGIGAVMKVPRRVRLGLLGVLYCAVLIAQFVLPEGNELREYLGGGPGPWLLLAGVVAMVLAYRAGLSRLRARSLGAPDVAPQTGAFSDVELERYARHIILRDVGGAGQRALREARVLVVGAGGLGSPALLYLAAAGVGTIGVIDDDTVSLSNLQRQVIHTDKRNGMAKVFSAESAMGALNPHVTIKPYNRRLTPEIAGGLLENFDVVLDGTDTFVARAMINAACVTGKVPLIAGAIAQWEGQVTVYDPARGAPCMACVFPEPPAPGQSATCAEAGVIGPLPGVIGTMMALEAIKVITGAGAPLRGRMMIWDGLYAEARTITIKRREGCAVCGNVVYDQ